MATTRQIAANRRNAIKSTGPKSRAGKQRVRNNALKHGLAASRPRVRLAARTVAAVGPPRCGVLRRPVPAGPEPAHQAHHADHGIRGPAWPGPVPPAAVRRLRAALPDPGAAAHRQDGPACRPDHPAPRPGADHQHPGRPVRPHQRATRRPVRRIRASKSCSIASSSDARRSARKINHRRFSGSAK